MRTPNSACIICAKPLYRRPNEIARTRYAACMMHRAQAQSAVGVTEAQASGLRLGRAKGTNHRTGYKHREQSKQKASASHKAWCAANPDRVAARAAAIRGANHYQWKGGASRLNVAIRQLNENRKWMRAVKERDAHCVECGSTEDLEAHHVVEITALIAIHSITSREQARDCAAFWALENGKTLCRPCHYALHGRAFNEAA